MQTAVSAAPAAGRIIKEKKQRRKDGEIHHYEDLHTNKVNNKAISLWEQQNKASQRKSDWVENANLFFILFSRCGQTAAWGSYVAR